MPALVVDPDFAAALQALWDRLTRACRRALEPDPADGLPTLEPTQVLVLAHRHARRLITALRDACAVSKAATCTRVPPRRRRPARNRPSHRPPGSSYSRGRGRRPAPGRGDPAGAPGVRGGGEQMTAPDPVDTLLERWQEAWRQGRPVAVEALCHDCPHLLDDLRRRVLDAQAATQQFRQSLAQLATTLSPGAATATQPDTPRFEPGQEPLPGYRLVKRLGQGGFGEVWQADAPGGFPVALKFVHLTRPTGEQELQALQVVRNVRHVHLLTLFGAWQVEGLLIIAMELADRTLLQRLDEAVGQGLAGIPRGELLQYAQEAAAALDYLNKPRHFLPGNPRPVGIQHCDVKPQNLLLLGEAVKVADFGLARVLEGQSLEHAGSGLTPAYAPPEFFDGRTSLHSDQYSLAVTYCHLRGGKLPFEGTAHHLARAHRTAPPDLAMLPEPERSAVARALAKAPEQRWPNCRAFVQALAAFAAPETLAVAPAAGAPTEPAPVRPALPPTQAFHGPAHSGRGPWAAAVVAAGLGAGALAAFLGYRSLEAERSSPQVLTVTVPPGRVTAAVPSATHPTATAPVEPMTKGPLPPGPPEQNPPVPLPAGPPDQPLDRAVGDLRRRRFAEVRQALDQQRQEKAPADAWRSLEALVQLQDPAATAEERQRGLARARELLTGQDLPPLALDLTLALAEAGSRSKDAGERQQVLGVVEAARRRLTPDQDAQVRLRLASGAGTTPEGTRAFSLAPGGRGGTGSRGLGGGFTPKGTPEAAAGQGQPSTSTVRGGVLPTVPATAAERPTVPTAAAPAPQGGAIPAEEPAFPWLALAGAGLAGLAGLAWWMWRPRAVPAAVPAAQPVGPRTLAGHGDLVWTVAFAPDGRACFTGSLDGIVRRWDLTTGHETARLEGHPSGVAALAVAPDGAALVAGSLGHLVHVWDLASGREAHRLTGHTDSVLGVAVSPDGNHILSGGLDHTVRLWDRATGAEVRRLEGPTEPVWAVAFTPDGRLALAASGGPLQPQGARPLPAHDCTVRAWDAASGALVRRFEGHTGPVRCLAVSPDGRRLATGSADATVRLWDVATGQPVRTLTGHTDWVRGLAFVGDGRLLSGGDDETVRLWDLATGEERACFSGHAWSVTAVAVSPDRQWALSGSDDQTARLWPIP